MDHLPEIPVGVRIPYLGFYSRALAPTMDHLLESVKGGGRFPLLGLYLRHDALPMGYLFKVWRERNSSSWLLLGASSLINASFPRNLEAGILDIISSHSVVVSTSLVHTSK